MEKRVMIVGGTGMLGRPVAFRFLTEGYKVRILTHSPKRAAAFFDDRFEIQNGDVTDPESLKEALNGCSEAYINLGVKYDTDKYETIEHLGTANVAKAAAEAGIKRIGMISGNRVTTADTGIAYLDAKAKAEEALKECGVPYTIFKCCWFFESLPRFIQGGKAYILGKQTNPLYWIAASDYAGMVVKAFDLEDAANRSFYIKGIDQMSLPTALNKFCDIVLPDAKMSYIALWLAKYATFFTRKKQMKGLVEFMNYFDKHEEPGISGEAERILGPALTTIEDWCEEYKRRLELIKK